MKSEDEDVSEAEEQKKDKESAAKDKRSGAMDARIESLTRQLKSLKTNATRVVLKEISQRDALAEQLSKHIGTFDHKDKTLDEVSAYGIKKLGLKCKPGHEEAMLSGFLAARRVNAVAVGQDRKVPASSKLQAYLNGDKK